MTLIERYKSTIAEACSEMKLDYFPQVEASELLYRVITLEDIYLPLSLQRLSFNDAGFDIDDLIRRIDATIAALEANNNEAESLPAGTPAIASDEHDIKATSEEDTELRLLITATPGGGKTTFCKRLLLAMLKHDEVFFQKYAAENDLHFSIDALPVFIICKNIEDVSYDEITTLSFPQLMFRLCAQSFGSLFHEITETDFTNLLKANESGKLCLVLDGWDEILDAEKEQAFCKALNQYLKDNAAVDVIITIRVSYNAPELNQPYTAKFGIRSLSDDEIREFCKKWCSIILTSNQRAQNYTHISEQILNSKDQQVRAMMKNPLDLSLLLTVSKNDGRLPDNKAELFKELVDLYIFWSTNKSTGTLSAKSIRVFLAYIASAFTKAKMFHCGEEELLRLIRQAIVDLEWTFPEDIMLTEPATIAKELSHTGILATILDGKRYSFSECPTWTNHRQMQEYLTAYAILAQYSDEEYNNMPPSEIFEDKYDDRLWREVLIFVALMNNGRLRQELVRRLISRAEEKPNDNSDYTDLLFDLVVSGADIRLVDKHKIYDIAFSKYITEKQIENIIQTVTSNSRSSSDLAAYIEKQFTDSVNNGDCEYGYAYAIIQASSSLQRGESPFVYAENLMLTDQSTSIVAGSQILLILAWCKYVRIVNAFSPFYLGYHMSNRWVELYKSLIENRQYLMPLLNSIRDAVLADFASFSDFFDPDDITNACFCIDNPEKKAECEIILSIAPVFGKTICSPPDVAPEVKDKYLQKLEDEINRKEYDEVAFSFSICSALGCFSLDEKEKKWKTIVDVYRNLRNDGYVGAARYQQILRSFVAEIEKSDSSQERGWWMKERTDEYMVYSCGSKKMTITFPEAGLTQDAKGFLNLIIPISTAANNNLAYLLRRQEIASITMEEDSASPVSPEQLLEDGMREHEKFSVINYALSIAKIRSNELGDYSSGKGYLMSIKQSLNLSPESWLSVAAWWGKLFFERNEYEGLVVLTWLFVLSVIDLSSLDHESLQKLSEALQRAGDEVEDFATFNKTILEELGNK